MKRRIEIFLLHGQFFVTAAMTGIVWLVQLVTYPQFLNVGAAEFPAYHEKHTAGMGWVVAPLMIFELGLAVAAAWHFRRSEVGRPLLVGALLAAALWLTTFLIQVPLHESLSSTPSDAHIRDLIETNWIRTVLWTARSGLLLWILCKISDSTEP